MERGLGGKKELGTSNLEESGNTESDNSSESTSGELGSRGSLGERTTSVWISIYTLRFNEIENLGLTPPDPPFPAPVFPDAVGAGAPVAALRVNERINISVP